MKNSSNLIMGATVVMVVILAAVLGLVLFLLAELYCSLLFSRRKNQKRDATAAAAVSERITQNDPPLQSFYSHGVLQAPRNFLFPAVPDVDLENRLPESAISGNQQCYTWPIEKNALQSASTSTRSDGEQLIYICNPIYDNEEGKKVDTPFETPDTSPSRLETGGSSPLSSDSDFSGPLATPPLTPMKKLPEVSPETSSSLCLRDVREICTTASDSNSIKGGISSSSSSGSPRTSPSW